MEHPSEADLDLDADLFMRKMLRDLTGLLQDVVGLDEAEGYINSVGTSVGRWIEDKYRAEMGGQDLDPTRIAEVFVDLKRRIGGDFYVISVTDDCITLGNRACPFGDMAQGRDALCMMTSNVFGRIAADHTGYARVELHETIARGDAGCRIAIHLSPDGAGPSDGAREYFRLDPDLRENGG
ncbi:methanogen output domain 1-containing protein [Pseudoponticoccus marisrubri]|uniref:methanogen output domain 1-containing protein n=1 Tax=Pseudoponticoccus marisrubri TaxID=1685382 RepID=UPI001F0B651F|nr:methanogen output domain 1-containing protein [Pseudoponticoccus marisrubri]